MSKNKKIHNQINKLFDGIKITEEVEHDAGVSLVHAPMGEEGFVVDIDNNFVYLGNKENNITTAVSRKEISTIKVVEPQDNVMKLARFDKFDKDDNGGPLQ